MECPEEDVKHIRLPRKIRNSESWSLTLVSPGHRTTEDIPGILCSGSSIISKNTVNDFEII